MEVGQHGKSLLAKAGMEADLASIKAVWQGRRSLLCSLSPCLGPDHLFFLQARATLGLLPSALPVAVLAELRRYLRCVLRRWWKRKEDFLFFCAKKRLTIPQSQIFPPGRNNSQFTGFPQGSLVLRCHHLELPWQGTHLLLTPYLTHRMNENV